MTTIRTRFAPSPTGFLHVGGIRTALFAWLVARQAGGQFILRLEDTDKVREVPGSREHLIASLKALSLEYDEGPDIGGPYGPYVQSERLDHYKQWAQKLINQGRAYADPYTPAEVQQFREQAQAAKKPFLYRDFRPENPPAWDGTRPLRFKSEPKPYTWHDEVMGDLSTGPEVIDDFILIKSDGYPTYNFAHIIDDLEMEITHVIRGQEFISSVPNYLNLYEALGFDMSTTSSGVTNTKHEPVGELQGEGQAAESISEAQWRGKPHLPVFATMPHIMNEQGNKKLGKRDGAKDVLDYIRDGYLPEAMVSFIATLGWNDGTTQEVFTRDELIQKFSLDRVGRSGARFDEKRLLWVNGHFIRELSLDELYRRVSTRVRSASEQRAGEGGLSASGAMVAPEKGQAHSERIDDFWPSAAKTADEQYKKQVLKLAQERLKTLADLPNLTSYFFEEPKIDQTLIGENKQLKKLADEDIRLLISAAHDKLASITEWTPETIQTALNELLEETGEKPGVLFSLVRIYTTWAPFSPQLNDTLALLGQSRTLARLASITE